MLMIEVIRAKGWKPRYAEGRPVLCETKAEACAVLKQLIADGEACVRARSGANVVLWGCLNPDGVATIGGANGLSRHAPPPPTC